VYLRYVRGTLRSLPAVVSRIPVQGGQPEILSSPPKRVGSTFYLADGQLAWSVIEQDNDSSEYLTRIETLSSDGTVSTQRTIPGLVDRVSPNPRGEGLYCHRVIGADRMVPVSEDIVFLPVPAGAEKDLLPVSSIGRFARSSDGKRLYVGDQGHL
jgi:hypothetical protein